MQPEENFPQQNNQEDEELISDFSNMFKDKKKFKKNQKKPKIGETNSVNSTAPNWLLQIPAKLNIERQDLEERKILDLRRWYSQVKTDEQNRKIISAVVSAWNYLYSNAGSGKDQQFSFASALKLFGQNLIQQASKVTEYGRMQIVMKLINELNKKTGHNASAKVVAKLAPPDDLKIPQNDMKKKLLEGLTSQNKAYIYLAYHDVLSPIGYEVTPLKPLDAYKKLSEIPKENTELWIITNGTGKFDHSFVVKRWSNIVTDLQTSWPFYYDINNIKEGTKRREEATQENEKEERGTGNCIIEIERIK